MRIEAYSTPNTSSPKTPTWTKNSKSMRWVVHDGKRAKNHLLEANLRLVVSLAKRYTGAACSSSTSSRKATSVLIRAVEKFDYSKGFKFSTYATWWIRQYHPRNGRPGSHHPHPRAHGRSHQQARPRAAPDAPGPLLRTHPRRTRQGTRHDPRKGHRSPEVRSEPISLHTPSVKTATPNSVTSSRTPRQSSPQTQCPSPFCRNSSTPCSTPSPSVKPAWSQCASA